MVKYIENKITNIQDFFNPVLCYKTTTPHGDLSDWKNAHITYKEILELPIIELLNYYGETLPFGKIQNVLMHVQKSKKEVLVEMSITYSNSITNKYFLHFKPCRKIKEFQ